MLPLHHKPSEQPTPTVSPHQPEYDRLNDKAEEFGIGRPFGGWMSPTKYHLTLGAMVLAAIERLESVKH